MPRAHENAPHRLKDGTLMRGTDNGLDRAAGRYLTIGPHFGSVALTERMFLTSPLR